MKKLITLLLSGLVLAGCGKSASSSNQFVGTWRNLNSTDQTLTITAHDGGAGYSVERAIPSRTIETFPAVADGNTLVVNQQITSTVISMKGDQLEAHMIPNCYKSDCNFWIKVK